MRDISVIRAEIEDTQIKIDLIEDTLEEYQSQDVWDVHNQLTNLLTRLEDEHTMAVKGQLL